VHSPDSCSDVRADDATGATNGATKLSELESG